MLNKIFPEKVNGEFEIQQNINDVENAIDKIAEKHYIKKENNEIVIIPKGLINVLGMTNPMRNYKKIIFNPVKADESLTRLDYTVYRKLSKASSVIYIIFLIIDILLIVGGFITFNSSPELALVIFGAAVFWIFISTLAFLFDYFVLFSKGAILRGFKNNVLRRVAALAKASNKNKGV